MLFVKSPTKEHITDALRYWEPRRIVYNLALALVTLSVGWPILELTESPPLLPAALVLFLLAAGANVLYCIAYPVDVFIQASEFREPWRKLRWLLFLCGLAIGMAAAWLVTSISIFPYLDPLFGFSA